MIFYADAVWPLVEIQECASSILETHYEDYLQKLYHNLKKEHIT